MTNAADKGLAGELTYTRFDRMAEKYPRNTAIIYMGETFSYSPAA